MLKEELKVIGQAILNEVEGYEFYKMAAGQAENGDSKEAFLELANEELKHVEYLKRLMNKIKDGVEDEIYLALEADFPSPEIYKWSKIEGKGSSLAMAVFGIAMQMEEDSIIFYENAKKNTEFEEARKIYDTLIKWEKVHLDQFTEQYNKLKNNWWAEQSFAPF